VDTHSQIRKFVGRCCLWAAMVSLACPAGSLGQESGNEWIDWSPPDTPLFPVEVEQESAASRFEIGLRSTTFTLNDRHQRIPDSDGNYYLGSIDELEEDRRLFPLPFVRWQAHPWVALDIGYERRRAITRTWSSSDTDGTLDLQGPSFALQLVYPDAGRWKPYIEVGRTVFNASFRYAEWWHQGFASDHSDAYAEWRLAGRPPSPNGGYQREISLSNTTGSFYGGGTRVILTPELSVEIGMRVTRVEVDAHYRLLVQDRVVDDRGTFTFPMDNRSFHLGASYRF
jgi:opacity protein-like surface antigen